MIRAAFDSFRRKSAAEVPPIVASLAGVEYRSFTSVNAAVFLAQALVVYAMSLGLLGTKSNKEVSQKYKTLVTPAGWAFAIWGLIYLSELSAVAYMFFAPPSELYAALSPAWVVGHVLQLLWAIAFAAEQVGLASLLLTGIALAMGECAHVLVAAGAAELDRVLVLVPVALHAGWLAAACLVNWNCAVVAHAAPLSVQVSLAFLTLHATLAIAVAAFAVPLGPANETMPVPFLVSLAWAMAAVAREADMQGEIRVVWPLRRALYYTASVVSAIITGLAFIGQAQRASGMHARTLAEPLPSAA